MQGKIIKGIAGFYYVYVEGEGVIECKAKGIFRKDNLKPLVGDNVKISLVDDENRIGNIIEIEKRKNALVRPAVANVDQAVVIFSVSYPKPNLNLLDRFILMMRTKDVPVVICFNKTDMVSADITDEISAHYRNSGCIVYTVSAETNDGVDGFRQCINGKTNVFAGPSGVGKSSLLNALFPQMNVETGEISRKIKRGKHTTRHSELFAIGNKTYIMDTPGFTSFELPMIEKEQLREYYPEFEPFEGKCRFMGCVHVNEPDCLVKEAVDEGEISDKRYGNYIQFFDEIRQRKIY